MQTLDVKFTLLRDRICAWEITENSGVFHAGFARPFKRGASMDKILPSEFFPIPYTKKQLLAAPFIGEYENKILDWFENADTIIPHGRYANAIRQTFGQSSRLATIFEEKASEPVKDKVESVLYVDFEAIDMRICGWYAKLVCGEEETEFSGIVKPYSDMNRLKKKFDSIYSKLLPYSFEEIASARHVKSREYYFLDMFRRADKIYTYGDTDALFVKHSFGDQIYNFFRVKNVDVSMRMAGKTLSLDKVCRIFNLDIAGAEHDPKVDVIKMMSFVQACENI